MPVIPSFLLGLREEYARYSLLSPMVGGRNMPVIPSLLPWFEGGLSLFLVSFSHGLGKV